MKPEVFTFLDLEMNKPSGKIIQIGAIVANIKTETVLEKLSVFINPNETLDPFIIGLTGISQEQVDSGVSLEEGYRQLSTLHTKYGSFCNFVQWGTGDSACLRNQLGLDNERFIGGRREIDVKTVYIAYNLANGNKIQSGLAKSLTRMGIRFEGKKHNATDDSYNTFRIFCLLLKKFVP